MSKKLHFALLFCTFSFMCSPLLASNEIHITDRQILSSEGCEAPVPDSFRTTSIGGTFITLAWNPAWVGATHHLSVSIKDEFGGWTDQYTFPDVPGSSFTVTDLESGKEYRFRIATKCPSGDPSELTAIVDDHTAIIELNIAGRNPKDPKPINGIGIPYQNYPWIGFKVSGEGVSNIFEIRVNENTDSPLAYVGRVHNSNPIVAVDPDGRFPNDFVPIIYEVPVPFQIDRLITNGSHEFIGRIDLALNPGIFPTLDIKVEDPSPFPWKNNYSFTALTAKETVLPGGPGAGQGFGNTFNNSRFEVQNPFKDNLLVFSPYFSENDGMTLMRLLNVHGKKMFEQKFDTTDSEVLLSLSWLAPGIYLLQIETEGELQTLKVIKSE